VTINGNLNGNQTFTDETVIVTGQLTGGTITLNNSTLIVEGGRATSPSASPAATVVMQSGINTVDLAFIAKASSANLTIQGLGNSDSIGIGQAFTNATFKSGGPGPNQTIGVVNFTTGPGAAGTGGSIKVTLASAADNSFFNTFPTSTIDGTQYTIATLDPPQSSTGATGATGSQDPGSTWVTLKSVLGGSVGKFLEILTGHPVGKNDPSLTTLFGGLSGPSLVNLIKSDLLKIGGLGQNTNNNNQNGVVTTDQNNFSGGTLTNLDQQTGKGPLLPPDHHH